MTAVPEIFDSLRESSIPNEPVGELGITHGSCWSDVPEKTRQSTLLSRRVASSDFFSCVQRAPSVSFSWSVIEKMLLVKGAAPKLIGGANTIAGPPGTGLGAVSAGLLSRANAPSAVIWLARFAA